jgi:hypothetical protein
MKGPGDKSALVKYRGFFDLAGSYAAATPRLRSDIRLYLPECRERRKQLLGKKARKLTHQYGESVLSTWETSFAAVERQSAIAARLLSLLAFLNFDDIFPAMLERFTGTESWRQQQAKCLTDSGSHTSHLTIRPINMLSKRRLGSFRPTHCSSGEMIGAHMRCTSWCTRGDRTDWKWSSSVI